jgi:thioredoxin 1
VYFLNLDLKREGTMGQHVSDVTDATFTAEVMESDVPVLVDFWATWCMPCKAIAPHVETLAGQNEGKLKVVKLDIQKNMKTAQAFKVTNIPTFIVFKNGREAARQTGAQGGLVGLKKLIDPQIS